MDQFEHSDEDKVIAMTKNDYDYSLTLSIVRYIKNKRNRKSIKIDFFAATKGPDTTEL